MLLLCNYVVANQRVNSDGFPYSGESRHAADCSHTAVRLWQTNAQQNGSDTQGISVALFFRQHYKIDDRFYGLDGKMLEVPRMDVVVSNGRPFRRTTGRTDDGTDDDDGTDNGTDGQRTDDDDGTDDGTADDGTDGRTDDDGTRRDGRWETTISNK